MSEEMVNSVGTSALLQLLSEDQEQVLYRPRLNELTNSVLGTILLQQINYWWFKVGRRPFYKFAAPCEHPKYRPGQSWQEELGFSRRELDTALRSVATKITKGVSKNEALAESLVIYWTDKTRTTYYQLNERRFGEALERIYLSNGASEHYQEMAQTDITFTETNQRPTNIDSPRGENDLLAKTMTTLTVDRTREVGFDAAPYQIANWGKGWASFLYVSKGEEPPDAEKQYAVLGEIVAAAAGQRGKGRFFIAVKDAVKKIEKGTQGDRTHNTGRMSGSQNCQSQGRTREDYSWFFGEESG